MAELEGALTAVATSSQQEVATALGSGDEGLLVASDVARRHGREPLLLAIDQFEECYGLARQEDRDAFVRRLARCVHGERDDVRVVVTVRADHYDDLLLDPHLGPWVADNTLAVSPMSGQELHEAITRPAARVGVDVEPHLVARMATEALGERARLPLVQFTLTELFSGREGGRLTLDAYERIGGVSGALVGRAEQLYATLDDRSQRLCRQVFLRLVTVTDGPDESLRRVLRDELLATGDADAVGAVLELFGRHRLLTFDRDPFTRRPTVEIAHHALTREWGRLRGWIDAARADIEMHHRVRAAADEWRLAGRDPSYLLRGTRLDEALAWMSASSIDLTDAERGFLEEGDQARRRRAAAERDRLEREAGLERRARRRLRTVAVVSAVAALVAVGLSAVAVQERSRAQQAQAAAEREARVAQARRLAAASMVQSGGDPDLGILLAIEAVRTTREQDGTVVPEAHQALLDAVVSSPLRDRFPGIGGHLALSPDGDLLVTEGPEDSGLIDVRDARTGDSIHAFHGHGASVGRRPPDLNAVTFGPDGRRLATTGDDGTLRIWDRVWETGGQREQFVFRGDGPSQVWGPSFHPDGELVAAAWADEGVVRVFDLATGQMTLELDGLDYPYAARFGPAGDRLAVPEGRGGRAVVLDAATGDQLLALPEGGGRGLAWSPDGRHLLTTSPGATARVWDTTDGSLRAGLFGHTHEVASGAWSSDGTRLATGSLDGTVRVWRLAEGGAEPLAVLGAAPTGVQGLAFTPDGTALYAGEEGDADATTVRVWDLTGTTTDAIATFPAATDGPSVVEHLAGGPVLLVSTGGETVTGWDVGTGRSVIELATELDGHGPLMDVASSPDGTRIAIAVGGHLSLRDADGDVVADVATPRSIGTVGWHPDSDRLAIGDRAGEVRVLGRDGEELATLLPDGGRSPTWAAYDVAFSPAGDLLAVAGGDPTQPNSWHVELWDWDAGQIQTTVATSGFNARAVAFAPDGTTIATVGFDAAELFDVATGDRIARLPGHGGPVLAVDFQPDGTRLATGGADATVRLWDPDAARQTLTIDGHRSAVESISFSADGTRLAAGDADGHARIWPLDVDELLRIAEDRVTRDLTDAECRQYLLTGSCPREWSRDLAGLRHG